MCAFQKGVTALLQWSCLSFSIPVSTVLTEGYVPGRIAGLGRQLGSSLPRLARNCNFTNSGAFLKLTASETPEQKKKN